MNTPKHTPGPWRVNGIDGSIWPTVGRRAPIATIFTSKNPESEGSEESDWLRPEEAANMALLASAPELLEALRQCVAMSTSHRWRTNSDEADVWSIARDAIAKAEGRQ